MEHGPSEIRDVNCMRAKRRESLAKTQRLSSCWLYKFEHLSALEHLSSLLIKPTQRARRWEHLSTLLIRPHTAWRVRLRSRETLVCIKKTATRHERSHLLRPGSPARQRKITIMGPSSTPQKLGLVKKTSTTAAAALRKRRRWLPRESIASVAGPAAAQGPH